MRGIGVCARCGAKLQWSGPRGKKNFLPPRAGETNAFQRFWRTLRPAMEHLGRRLAASRIFHSWHNVPKPVLIATFLSIVPGLGHFYQKRILAGLGFAAAWTTLFCLLLTSYPWSPSFGSLTFLIHFLASSTHILSMVSASRPREFRCGRREVLALLLPLAAIVYATYFYLAYTIESRFMSIWLPPNAQLQAPLRIALPLPPMPANIFLLLRRGAADLKFGDIIVIDFTADNRGARFRHFNGGRYGLAIWLAGFNGKLNYSDGVLRLNDVDTRWDLTPMLANNAEKEFHIQAGEGFFLALLLARLPTLTEEELPDIFQYPDATLLGRAEYIIHGRDSQWPEPITAFGGTD
jgi:hypothetical protein